MINNTLFAPFDTVATDEPDILAEAFAADGSGDVEEGEVSEHGSDDGAERDSLFGDEGAEEEEVDLFGDPIDTKEDEATDTAVGTPATKWRSPSPADLYLPSKSGYVHAPSPVVAGYQSVAPIAFPTRDGSPPPRLSISPLYQARPQPEPRPRSDSPPEPVNAATATQVSGSPPSSPGARARTISQAPKAAATEQARPGAPKPSPSAAPKAKAPYPFRFKKLSDSPTPAEPATAPAHTNPATPPSAEPAQRQSEARAPTAPGRVSAVEMLTNAGLLGCSAASDDSGSKSSRPKPSKLMQKALRSTPPSRFKKTEEGSPATEGATAPAAEASSSSANSTRVSTARPSSNKRKAEDSGASSSSSKKRKEDEPARRPAISPRTTARPTTKFLEHPPEPVPVTTEKPKTGRLIEPYGTRYGPVAPQRGLTFEQRHTAEFPKRNPTTYGKEPEPTLKRKAADDQATATPASPAKRANRKTGATGANATALPQRRAGESSQASGSASAPAPAAATAPAPRKTLKRKARDEQDAPATPPAKKAKDEPKVVTQYLRPEILRGVLQQTLRTVGRGGVHGDGLWQTFRGNTNNIQHITEFGQILNEVSEPHKTTSGFLVVKGLRQ
ncbi:hypothetical protein HDZ31DRAFT_61441 [Schizophyllum fasciatum]